ARLAPQDQAALRALTERYEWIWISGNHDPAPPESLGGQTEAMVKRGPLHFRHEPASAPVEGELAGHLHPCARLRLRGRTLRRRCFASDGRRLILPGIGCAR
ncbi:MAG TPA: phosphoesterase, partial [Alphaproteobacteria bacterium]|nr:phosphoesterase [Alphaproteobacteria bacterium]